MKSLASVAVEPIAARLSAATVVHAGIQLRPVIISIKLYHRQVYEFAWHRAKLAFVRDGTLDDKRIGDTKFSNVADFVESIPTKCPHDLFRRDDGARGSQLSPNFIALVGEGK